MLCKCKTPTYAYCLKYMKNGVKRSLGAKKKDILGPVPLPPTCMCLFQASREGSPVYQ